MTNPSYQEIKKNEKYEKLYVRLCSKQTNDYMNCLNSHDKKIQEEVKYCEEIRKKYISCINYNNYNNNQNERISFK